MLPQAPVLFYEDVFNMVAVCKDDQGALLQYPLLPHKDHDNLCYSPAAGLLLESSIPASIASSICKLPASHMQTLAAEVGKKDDENEDAEQDQDNQADENDGDECGENQDGEDGEQGGEDEKAGEQGGENEKVGEQNGENEVGKQSGENEKVGDKDGAPRCRVVGKRPTAQMDVPELTQVTRTQPPAQSQT